MRLRNNPDAMPFLQEHADLVFINPRDHLGKWHEVFGNNNPIAARDLSGNNNVKKTYFQGNIAMKYQLPFVKGLSVKLNASYLKNYTMQKKYFLTYDVYGWNQTTRQGNVETGRIANKVSLNQWFTESKVIRFNRLLSTQ
mgnify:FL=1